MSVQCCGGSELARVFFTFAGWSVQTSDREVADIASAIDDIRIMIGALSSTTLSGHPRHVLPVEINLLGFLAGKGTGAQKKPPSPRSTIGV
jgi:hypothetical protein